MIYFIQAGDGGPIKIGYASHIGTRLGALQVSNPTPLVLLASMRGEIDDEARVHRQFLRHRLRGEWFSPATEILAFCAMVGQSEEGPRLPGKSIMLNFRVTDETMARIKIQARTDGVSVSGYLRDCIDAALKRDERKAKETS